MATAADPQPGATGATAVLIVNLGTPDAPTAAAVRPYLREFLSDPRVVEIPRLVWWPILHGIVLRTRPRKSAAKYASVWLPEGSPLAVWTQRQATLLLGSLGERGHRVVVRHAMRYGQPSVSSVLDELMAERVERVLVLPMYPQYAAATAASVLDAVTAWTARTRRVPSLRFVGDFHDDAGYIGALAHRVQQHWLVQGRADRLVLSFHGLPQRCVDLGDPYQAQCQATARALASRLGITMDQVLVTFQSRFGKARWIEPATEPTLVALAQQGVKRVDVACPGFVADCLETLEEIDQEAREAFLGAGGSEFRYIPCLNDDAVWMRALAALAERELQGWPTGATVSPRASA